MNLQTSRPTPIRAVCFDAFGTVIQYRVRRRPYRLLHDAFDAEALMTRNTPITQLLEEAGLGGSVDEALEGLREEFRNCSLFDEVPEVMSSLHARGMKVAICSNLAHAYGPLVRQLLPDADATLLSYEVGAIKPQPAIYQAVCQALELPAESVFFTGDSHECDYLGPQSIGMPSAWLDRANGQTLHDVLAAVMRHTE